MKVNLNIELDGVLFEKTVEWGALPDPRNLSQRVELTEGGWSEPAYGVWFNAMDGSITVEIGSKQDHHGEDLAQSLLLSGWKRA